MRAHSARAGSAVSTYSAFAYDGVFNLTGLAATVPGSTGQGGATSWSYDSKDRLAQESSARLGGYTDNFAYDTAGNPTTWKGSTRTYNSNNQRTGSGTFAYDGNGNPTTYTGGIFGTATCTYDRENRLTAIGSSWTAGYRADGLRAWKQVGSTKVYYLYDSGNPVMELDSSGNVVAVNGYGADGLYARWWAWNNSATTYYMFDQQGNIAERYDGNGNLISSNMNDAYGNEAYSTYGNDPFGYNAKWGYSYDRETGMFLCQHRYYDPANGRWITRDPIGYAGGLNVYGYCEGGPNDRVDHSGYAPWFVGQDGGPFHFTSGPWANPTQMGCKAWDNCATLKMKAKYLKLMIRSHNLWDAWNYEQTGGTSDPNRHIMEVTSWRRAITKCNALIQRKCSGSGFRRWCQAPEFAPFFDPEMDEASDCSMNMQPVWDGLEKGAVVVGVGALIILSGGLLAPVLL